MGRENRIYDRIKGVRNPDLIVIAAEGACTEIQYFEGLREEWGLSKMQVNVLTRKDPTLSSPEHVLQQLKEYKKKYGLKTHDELCLLIDLDHWGDEKIADIAKNCNHQQFFLALSNPCFEIWLLLHLLDFENLTVEQKNLIKKNAKTLKKEIRKLLGSFNPSNLKIQDFLPYIETAIQRAENLDTDKNARWQENTGSRVYEVIKKIQSMIA